MAFGSSSVLDDFNRANAIPPSASWTMTGGTSFALRLISNQVDSESNVGSGTGYWNPSTFGPDCEVFATLATIATVDAETVSLLARGINTASATLRSSYRYRLGFRTATGDEHILWRVDNNVNTQLGATALADVAAGNKIGLECIGSAITLYHFTGGNWVKRVEVSDSTYSAPGDVGLFIQNQVWKLDDFAGGTVVVPAGVRNSDYTRFPKPKLRTAVPVA